MAAIHLASNPTACSGARQQHCPVSRLHAPRVYRCAAYQPLMQCHMQQISRSAGLTPLSHRPSKRRAVAVHAAAAYPFKKKDARLVLEDGSVWPGTSFGAKGTEIGEVVFNTSMTGYQEIMTDPSYKGQFVCFTHPHIGNVGINDGELQAPVLTGN